MSAVPPHSHGAAHHTYVAGEDEGRLATAAQDLGLDFHEEGRLPKKSWAALLWNDSTLTAARMHSVGTLGQDERLDEYGTLHLMSVRKKHRQKQQQQYQHLTDLFARPEDTTAKATTTTATYQKPTTSDILEQDEEEEDEGEEEEEEVIDQVEGGSLGAAAFGIVKGTVGPAILYLPRGFYSSGYAVAIPAMMFATGMFILNAYRLLDCWKVESDRNHQVESRLKEVQALLQQAGGPTGGGMMGGGGGGVTAAADSLNIHHAAMSPKRGPPKQQYGTTAVQQDALFTPKLLTYPELAKRALGGYAVLVELGIALFQFGVCLTYLIFVPDNLYQCWYSLTGTRVPKLYFLWIMILVEIPLNWIRDIRKLTPTNVIASFLIALGLCAVLVIAFVQGTQTTINTETNEPELVFVQNLHTLQPLTETWFLFVGTSFFMMEGSITLLVPLQEAVYRPEDKSLFPEMNRNVTTWICVFYIIFSAIACAAFGSSIQTALTASLEGTLATMVQLAYSIAVILTFPLQAFPAMEVAIRMLHQISSGGSNASADFRNNTMASDKVDWKRNMFATTIVIMLGIIAVCSIDYLGNVVSILGSLFGIPLALVFPPLMHNQLVKDSSRTTKWINYGVVVIGFLAMGAASFNTIVTWDQGAEH